MTALKRQVPMCGLNPHAGNPLEEKFIFGPYIHHVAGVYGKYSRAIEEAARYLPIKWDEVGTGPRSL